MVGLGGLEPPTSPLSGARSSHLSYRPVSNDKFYHGRDPIASLGIDLDAAARAQESPGLSSIRSPGFQF